MTLLDSCVFFGEVDGTNLMVDKLGITTLTDNATVTTNPGPTNIPTAAQFTSANSEYMSAPDSAQLSGADVDIFWLAWVYLDSKPGAADMKFLSKLVGPTQREVELGWRRTTDRFEFTVSGDGVALVSVESTAFGAPSLATWYCVMVYHDATANEISISVNNGAFQTPVAYTAGIFNSTSGLRIGARAVPNSFFNGRCAQVIYWKGRIPDATERTQMYNAGDGLSYAQMLLADGFFARLYFNQQIGRAGGGRANYNLGV